APVKFMTSVAYLGLSAVVWVLGGSMAGARIDEVTFAELVGWPPVVVAAAGVVFLAAAWHYVVHRLRAERRLLLLVPVAVGGVAGLALWTLVVGPAVLP